MPALPESRGEGLKVLVAFEFSGIVREAFKKKGHDAWSCDLLPTEIPGQHIQGDVRNILYDGWDMLLAFDPCTFQCNSGVRWLINNPERMKKLKESCELTKQILNAPIAKIVRENPIPHKYALELIEVKYSQIIQPWQFGHGETKATCLWIKGLPLLKPTNIVTGREQRIHKLPPSKDRWKRRSRTFRGIAEAMANQWS
jgi:hypothetical protein